MYYLKKEQELLGGTRNLQSQSSDAPKLEFVQDQLKQLESLLKIAGCIKMELVPGSENNLEKKQFSWTLQQYDATKIVLKLEFEHPEFISMEAQDSVKVSF